MISTRLATPFQVGTMLDDWSGTEDGFPRLSQMTMRTTRAMAGMIVPKVSPIELMRALAFNPRKATRVAAQKMIKMTAPV